MKTSLISPEKVMKFLLRLARERFYGVVEIHFENGRIYRVRKLHNIESEEMDHLINN